MGPIDWSALCFSIVVAVAVVLFPLVFEILFGMDEPK